jgi:hypothetical protein
LQGLIAMKNAQTIAKFDCNEGCSNGLMTFQFSCNNGRLNDLVVCDDDFEPLHRLQGCSRTSSAIVMMIMNTQVWLW